MATETAKAAPVVLDPNFDPKTVMNSGKLIQVPITEIINDKGGVRKTVNKKDPAYAELLNSIRRDGIVDPLLLRANHDPNIPYKYVIVDGFHRWTGAYEILEEQNAARKAAGQPEIDPKTLVLQAKLLPDASRMDVYRLQLLANLTNVATRPLQVHEHLMSMIAEAEARGQILTQSDIAKEVNKSQTWVSNMLRLKSLNEQSKKLVEEGKISAANAYNLARLPEEEQEHWVKRSMTMGAEEFGEQVNAELIKVNEAKRKDRAATRDVFQAVPKLITKPEALRQMDEWFNKYIEPNGGEDFVEQIMAEITKADKLPGAFIVGAYYAMQKFLELDSDTVARKEAEHKAEVAERERARAEKDAKKLSDDAHTRGVSILMPKGKEPLSGFRE